MNIPRQHFWAVLPIAGSASALLCGYEFIRSASNTLFKAAYGPENLTVVMASVPVGVILAVIFYGRLLSRIGPRRSLLVTMLLSALAIGGCYLAVRSGSKLATGVLYVVREVYVVLLIEQYWSFVNSSLSETSAKKLEGLLLGIATLGAIAGGLLVGALAEPLGTETMLLFAAGSMVPAALLSDLAYARSGEPRPAPQEEGGRSGHLGLKLFKANRLLPTLLGLVIATQVVSTALSLNFQTILYDVIPENDAQTAYSGRFYAKLNSAALFLQFVVAPFVLRLVPVRVIHAIIPLIHIGACAAFIALPSLAAAGLALLLFKAFDYSIFRIAKEILYIPLSFDARYRAKQIIDFAGYRFSKGGTGGFIKLAEMLGLAVAGAYAHIALLAAGAWLALIFPLTRRRV